MTTLMDTLALVELGETLWRVTKHDGEVLGYVEAFEAPGGTRYRAKRMIIRQQRFIAVGEFWLMGDAVDCFR